jgi:hypothetical protein
MMLSASNVVSGCHIATAATLGSHAKICDSQTTGFQRLTMLASELTAEQLDYWVARGKGLTTFRSETGELLYHPGHNLPPRKWQPTRYWSQGGPLIEEQRIDLNWDTEGGQEWSASLEPDILAHGGTVLEAAMRAFVIRKFGETLSE